MHTVLIGDVYFEWDPRKNRANLSKHGVSFEEARTVILDEAAIRYFDPDHSHDEDRFLMLGMSAGGRILVVCHCSRLGGSAIRIISARKANAHESKNYPG